MSQNLSNADAPSNSSNTALAQPTAFDQAMAHAEAGWSTQNASAPLSVSREDALGIVANALAEEIKTGKPLEEVYGRASLVRLLQRAVEANDLGVFDHLAHDVANAFGVKDHTTKRLLPDNAGVHYTDIHAHLTGSCWVLLTDAKKAIARAAKELWTQQGGDFSPADPQAGDFINALSSHALYDPSRPPVLPRAKTAAGNESGEAPATKKRPSM